MRKRDELADPTSCLNIAKPDERLFVLLARDAAAPTAIRAWCAERIRLGKNKPDDEQIVEAESCALLMETERGDIVELRQNAGHAYACAGCGRALQVVSVRCGSCGEVDGTPEIVV